MSVKQDALYTAIAGKAIERGLDASIENGHVLVRYGPGEDKASDHLHKQVVRNLVSRLTPDAVSHLFSLEADPSGQPTGFKVTVDFPQPQPKPELLAPDWVTGLSAEEKLAMIRQLVA